MKDSQRLAISANDLTDYIMNYRYGEDACGENGLFNCWGLLRDVQKRFFDIQLPKTSLGDDLANLYAKQMRSGFWEVVEKPFHGCGVLMRTGLDPHCGVWLEFDGVSGVLHCERGNGVLWQNVEALRVLGYGNLKYYRFNK